MVNAIVCEKIAQKANYFLSGSLSGVKRSPISSRALMFYIYYTVASNLLVKEAVLLDAIAMMGSKGGSL